TVGKYWPFSWMIARIFVQPSRMNVAPYVWLTPATRASSRPEYSPLKISLIGGHYIWLRHSALDNLRCPAERTRQESLRLTNLSQRANLRAWHRSHVQTAVAKATATHGTQRLRARAAVATGWCQPDGR